MNTEKMKKWGWNILKIAIALLIVILGASWLKGYTMEKGGANKGAVGSEKISAPVDSSATKSPREIALEQKIAAMEAERAKAPTPPTPPSAPNAPEASAKWTPPKAVVTKVDREKVKGGGVRTLTTYHQELFDTNVTVRNARNNIARIVGFCKEWNNKAGTRLKAVANAKGDVEVEIQKIQADIDAEARKLFSTNNPDGAPAEGILNIKFK